MTGKKDAFISYTRQEGAALAQEACELLKSEGLSVWQDRTHVRGGEDFRRQIEEAIEDCHYLVMILTSDAFRGDREVLRGEWLTARRRGVPVVPVFRGFDWKDEAIPPWLGRLHCLDIENPNERQTLLNTLRSPPARTVRIPHNVEFPPQFVARPREQDEAVRLLTEGGGSSRVALTTALRGAGGFGKTTLAKALCFDDRVIATFTDGVLWATVGEGNRDPVEIFRALLGCLTDERLDGLTLESAQGRWRELIRTRRCLVVLDDVWRESDALAIVVRESPSAFLITTRIPAVSVALDACDCLVDRMEPAQAGALLGRALGQRRGLGPRIEGLARRLGYWPVLLKLAAARIALAVSRNASPEQALEAVAADYDEMGVTAFDATNAKSRDEAVEKSIQASLRFVEDESGAISRAYEALAVVPDDVQVPLDILAGLWDCGQARARRIGETLADAALLDLDYGQGAPMPEVRLHDVFLHYLRERATDLPALHRRLLDRWGEPRQLPSPYAWRWYGWHCLRGYQPERLRASLLDPGWLAGKLVRMDANTLIADCGLLLAAVPADRTLRLLQDALRKSSHVLGARPEILWEQLYGRLRPHLTDELDQLQSRLADGGPWPRLHAQRPNLEPAGSSLLRTLPGHRSQVYGALVLEGEHCALSWSDDKTLRLWDLETGEARELSGHEDWVRGAVQLGGGRRALSWSADNTLRLWDLETGESRALSGHAERVNGAVVLEAGRRALSWSDDKTLRLWDLETGQSRALVGHGSAVIGGMVLEGDRRALSWSYHDSTLRLWDLETGESRALFGHHGWVSGAVVLEGSRRALSWSSGKILRLWDLETGEAGVLSGHEDRVSGAVVLDRGRRVLSWSEDMTLRLWNLESGGSAALSGHGDRVNGAAVLEGGRRALSWSSDKTLRIWRLESGESSILSGHEGPVRGAALLEGDRRALSWSSDGTLRLWDLETGESRALAAHEDAVTGAVVLARGRRALSWSDDDRTLRLWDLETGASRVPSGHVSAVIGAVLLEEDRQAVSWSSDKTLRLWDVESGESRALSGHRGAVVGAVVLKGARSVLSWSSDGTLRLWDLETGNSRVFFGHENAVIGAAVIEGARRALSWSSDRTLRLWDLDTGESRALSGHGNAVIGAVVLEGGRHTLSWSYDKTLRLWDLESGQSRMLSGHEDAINGAAVFGGGRRAVSWSDDNSLRIWDLASFESRKLSGHLSAVIGAVVLDGGRRALSWSYDKTLRFWDLETGESRTLSGHGEGVWGAVLLAEDRRALSWSYDSTLRLWDLETGESRELSGHEGRVWRAILVDGERRVLSWSEDRTLRLWDVATRRELGFFAFDAMPTLALPLPDDRILVGDRLGGTHWLQFSPGPASSSR